MHLQQRIKLLAELGNYMASDSEGWQAIKRRAAAENPWFMPEFIELAVANIHQSFLDREKLEAWVAAYQFPSENQSPKNIGVVMAGNIPLVGFHDFLSVFISGHRQTIKASARDSVLIKHLAECLYAFDKEVEHLLSFADLLKGCDAYIATGSNNSARYFDYYFSKYPHLIRRNRTSVAILTGDESEEELEKLADDACLYFGLGCRNVTKIWVPENYDFIPLLRAFNKYDYFGDNHKYRNNYDYQLALQMMNKKYYMTNGTTLFSENESNFSAVSVMHYGYYTDRDKVIAGLTNNQDIQCVINAGTIPYGQAQQPGLMDYADGVDTLQFLRDV